MADPQNNDVKIHAPDRALQSKIGLVSLDQIITPQMVADAQSTVQESTDQFTADMLVHMKELEEAWIAFQQAGMDEEKEHLLPTVIHASFALKTAAGFGGYDLVAALAKSLHLHAEAITPHHLAPKNKDIMAWHVSSLRQLLSANIKGSGGATGQAILAEIQRLTQ